MKVIKKEFLINPKKISHWWQSHAMAPTAVLIDPNTIRIFVGAWDDKGISRIGYIDICANSLKEIKAISSAPVIDIGAPGTFDDNGVFPGHAYIHNGTVFLYYTGFQLSDKIRHFNFGGLATSTNGVNFKKESAAPILDRADEGLHVRAGQSILFDGRRFLTTYSAGSDWQMAGGKLRPVYDVFFQTSDNPRMFGKTGRRIIACDLAVEHGLGRPQICTIGSDTLVFYTRRLLSMKYSFGCARKTKGEEWVRLDRDFDIPFGRPGEFDSSMVYFPSFLNVNGRNLIFYSGNDFGKAGIGVLEFEY